MSEESDPECQESDPECPATIALGLAETVAPRSIRT